MEYGENPENLKIEAEFISCIEALLGEVAISEHGERASAYHRIDPGTPLAELAMRATQGDPEALQIRQVSYPMEYGVDNEYFVSFFERSGDTSIKVSYDLVDGELKRSINFVGSNPNAKGLARNMGGTDKESRQKALEYIKKLMQDEEDKEQAKTTPKEDPESFEAVIELLKLLAKN